MNIKARKTKKQAKAQNSSINVLSAEELAGKVETIKKELKSYTWRNLAAISDKKQRCFIKK